MTCPTLPGRFTVTDAFRNAAFASLLVATIAAGLGLAIAAAL